MAVLQYDFTGHSIGAKGLNPRLSHLGMMEFHIDKLPGLAGGKAALILGLVSFNMPEGRSVNDDAVNYFNGKINFPTTVDSPSELSCTFQDYINGRQREILHSWFNLICDADTGLGIVSSALKAEADAVLFDRDGTPNLQYHLYGIFPKKEPSFPDLAFGQGNLVKITIGFKVDWYTVKKLPTNYRNLG